MTCEASPESDREGSAAHRQKNPEISVVSINLLIGRALICADAIKHNSHHCRHKDLRRVFHSQRWAL